MIEDVAVFEQAAKKSWQSFSTMRRFVDEATRLENTSWRLWFMQGRHRPDSSDGIDVDHVTEELRLLCVYCELHSASLSCHGCCHDAYCISCFKLIHKKGNLATHTAVKIHHQHMEGHGDGGGGGSSSGASTVTEEADLSTTSLWSMRKKNVKSDVANVGGGDASGSLQKAGEFSTNKPWELQMDMLLQRLMVNSIHSELDVGVHNIDARDTLDTLTTDAEGTAPLLSIGGTSESDEKSNQAVVAAAVAAAGRHRAHSLTFEEKGKTHSPVRPNGIHPSLPPGVDGNIPEGMALPTSLFPENRPRANSRRTDSQICANCSGNHITVECPLLESAFLPSTSAVTSGGSGVDTVLRKCYTTIHNSNMANSTHAFLGDEVSVRGGSNFANMKQWPSGNALQQMDRPSPFGMNVIAEDNSMANDDIVPMLGKLAVPNAGGRLHSWSADSWLLSCLATELPSDVFEQQRELGRGDKHRSFSAEADSMKIARTGWAHVKVQERKWCKRFMSLYRNNLWEYLDTNEASRPVGHANLSEGSVHPQHQSTVDFVLKYNSHSSDLSACNEVWLKFDSKKDAKQWKEVITRATTLDIDDLFDLTPDSPTGTPRKNFELGKGRFSVVRRARRKQQWGDSSCSRDSALKIVEKKMFWDLVARDTEREDTVVREILTQSLLTVRSGSSYCPVIRLQSLFETRDHLVMEMELMRDGDLHEEIAMKSAVDETRASFLIASLVQAIDYCQRNGVAHRDVKLSNLALDCGRSSTSGKEYSVIKIADFGMAAFIQPDGMLRGRCGTPGFVAPEILSAGKGQAYLSGVDMFSAGVVAYTMLCGYEPFFGVNDEELIQMNKRVDYEFEEPEWASISDDAKDMICRMMEKDPYQRITPKEVLKHPFLREANIVLEELFREQEPIHPTRLL
uniref:Uncharacterized protein n=1 Tax=Peronospora matthiolae TaxID=2874970 RepID=A0AAV1UQW3_9STRA